MSTILSPDQSDYYKTISDTLIADLPLLFVSRYVWHSLLEQRLSSSISHAWSVTTVPAKIHVASSAGRPRAGFFRLKDGTPILSYFTPKIFGLGVIYAFCRAGKNHVLLRWIKKFTPKNFAFTPKDFGARRKLRQSPNQKTLRVTRR